MKEKIEILIVSSPDREMLMAEIWFNNYLIAIINQEHDELEIELYPTNKNSRLTVENFCDAINKAKSKLLGL